MATIRTTLVVVLLGLGIGVGFHSPFLIVEDGHFGKGNANDNFSQKIFFVLFGNFSKFIMCCNLRKGEKEIQCRLLVSFKKCANPHISILYYFTIPLAAPNCCSPSLLLCSISQLHTHPSICRVMLRRHDTIL